jgi:hypothetical protein
MVVMLGETSSKLAWFKNGSGTYVRSTLRAVPAKAPDPFLNHASEFFLLKMYGYATQPVATLADRPGTTTN